MILIRHRRNTRAELEATPRELGIEVDIRSQGDDLVIHHDPFVVGERFEDWLQAYAHATLILNVKEYLKTRSDVDSERIGVQGSSLGAVSAILAAAETPEIKGVVAEIPFKDLPSAIAHAFEHPGEGAGLPSFQ